MIAKHAIGNSVVIGGMGRCGTTSLYNAVWENGFKGSPLFLKSFSDVDCFTKGYVYKTHAKPPKALQNHVKVVYLIGNVMDMVISAHKKINHWGNAHHLHLNSDKFVENDSVFDADTMQLERHFDSWFRPQYFPFMSVHYNILYEQNTTDKINDFLGTKIKMPAFKTRETTWESHPKREQLLEVYGSIFKKVEDAEKVKLWQPYTNH
jgi:hypothetical protein